MIFLLVHDITIRPSITIGRSTTDFLGGKIPMHLVTISAGSIYKYLNKLKWHENNES